MPSSRRPIGFAPRRLVFTLLLTWSLAACGSSPSLVGGPGSFETGEAGSSSNGNGGAGKPGFTFDGGDQTDTPDADTTVSEAGPGCGDGLVNQGDEECDDGNTLPGDGCSGACTKEDFSDCPAKGGPCKSTVVCGDGKLEGAEVCDDGNARDADGCSSDCLVSDPSYDCSALAQMCINLVVCGDGKVTGDEACDDAKNPRGCSDDCSAVEDGYLCGQPGKACTKVKVPVCGDGSFDPGEQCDDGNNDVAGDGCSSACLVDAGWVCPTAGARCLQEICGNGVRTPDEECDDGNKIDGDGCSSSGVSAATKCKVNAGYVCPTAGQACIPKCGDGAKNGYEQCEDGNAKSGDGCSSACLLEPGYVCGVLGAPCTKAICGKNGQEADEGCDDGNTIYGDGCSGVCQNEPTFSATGVAVVACGDGIHVGSEACDDGNKNAGDGCDAACNVELGFKCSDAVVTPDFIDIKVRYHDFKPATEAGGHPDFEDKNGAYFGLTGQPCTTTNQSTCGVLNANGKPTLVILNSDKVSSAASFAQWYVDVANVNKGIDGSIRLARQGLTGAAYAFDSSAFFPLDGNPNAFPTLYGNPPHDFGFTTELDYFFQYNGGEELTFRGDDDVWVFINRKLAVDIGGIHGASWGRVTLGDESSVCSVHGGGSLPACTPTINAAADARFGLVKGGIYQISFFQAERHTSASNFRLSLQNFLPAHSLCAPNCGDGKIVIGEVCDDGAAQNTGEYGHCNATCSARQFCGDGLQNGPEQCDNGSNLAGYNSAGGCSAGCVPPPKCGDAKVDLAFGEQCDKGTAQNLGDYGGCKPTCQLGPFCGDNHPDAPQETCDSGPANGGYGKACGYDCQPGARCGDGIKNGNETCDLGDGKNVGGYGGCKANCAQDIRCGDGVKNGSEQCDDGKNVGGYGKCAPGCVYGARCGDGIKNGNEQCDDGVNDGAYGKCARDCKFGPRCGDNVVQEPEACDNGPANGKGVCSTSCQIFATK